MDLAILQDAVDRHKGDITDAEFLAICDAIKTAHKNATHYIAWYRVDRTVTDTFYNVDGDCHCVVEHHSTNHRRILRLDGFSDPRTARISRRAVDEIQRDIADTGFSARLHMGHHYTFVKLSAYATHPDLEAACDVVRDKVRGLPRPATHFKVSYRYTEVVAYETPDGDELFGFDIERQNHVVLCCLASNNEPFKAIHAEGVVTQNVVDGTPTSDFGYALSRDNDKMVVIRCDPYTV